MKMSFVSMTIAMLTLTASLSASAYQEEIKIGHKWWGSYVTGERITHDFGKPTRIERIMLAAEATCGQYAQVSVYVDGKQEATFAVPRVDPNYSFPIKTTGSHLSMTIDGCAKLQHIRAYVDGSGHQPLSVGGMSSPLELSQTTLNVVAALQEHASDYAFNTYLKPIRRAAIYLAASDRARDPQSNKTGSKSQALIKAINNAEGYLDNLSDREYYVEAVQTLLTVKERLEKLYDLP